MERMLALRFRLEPDGVQGRFFARAAGCVRLVRNLGVEQRELAWRHGRHKVSRFDQDRELKDLKSAHPWLAEAPHHCLQQALLDADRAYAAFFAGRAAHPKPRRKGDGDSLRFPDPKQFRAEGAPRGVGWGRIRLPKAGWVRFRQSRPIVGAIRQATVVREGRRWFLCLQVRQEVPDPIPADGPPVGIDRGVVAPLALSDGTLVDLPRMGKRDRRRERRLARALARKRKGSRNRRKAADRLASFRRRWRRRRHDALHKATTAIARAHPVVVIEALRVRAMTAAPAPRPDPDRPGAFLPNGARAKAGLDRAILERCWGETRRQLGYKLPWMGGDLVEVPAPGTSIECPPCGHADPANRPSRDAFRCVRCGHAGHADLVAAVNILRRWERRPGTAGGQPVAVCGGDEPRAHGPDPPRSRKPGARAPGIPAL